MLYFGLLLAEVRAIRLTIYQFGKCNKLRLDCQGQWLFEML